MDIKDLNKSQLILLAVLLSFVTSIVTGITTVTLMQQAPASVTTPINRIVQQTVERIQQVEGKTTVQTVVVKEEDLVVDAISKNRSAVFSITKNGVDASFNPIEVSAGSGFVVSNDGVIAADSKMAPEKEAYFVKNVSGKFKAQLLTVDKAGFSLLKIGEPVNGTDKLTFTVPDFGDISKMKIGQKMILIGNNVGTEIFEGLNPNGSLSLNAGRPGAGALVLNLDGEALGIALSGETNSFAGIKVITDALAAAQ